MFFLKDYLTYYFQRNTTFISRNEEVETLEFPTLIFCIKSGYRQLVMEKYNFSSIYNAAHSFELMNELTYLHGTDYRINVSSNVEFEETEIFTFVHGKCHKMQPKSEVSTTMRVIVDIEKTLTSNHWHE